MIPVLPELFLLATFVALLVSEITYSGEKLRLISMGAIIGIAATFVQMLISFKGLPIFLARESYVVDGVAVFFKFLIILLAAFSAYLASTSTEVDRLKNTEVFSFIVLGTLFGFISVSSTHLVLTGLALTGLASISVFLSCYSKKTDLSTQATVRFLLPAFVSLTLFWLGVLFVLRGTGSYELSGIRKAIVLADAFPEWAMLTGILWTLGLSMFLGWFPGSVLMTRWFEGIPTPASGFLIHLLRLAGVGVTLRLGAMFLPEHENALVFGERAWVWSLLLALISAATMLYGAVRSLGATTLRSMLSYYYIVQAGYWLVGVVSLQTRALPALEFSILIELFAGMGATVFLSNVIDAVGTDSFSGLRQISRRGVYLEMVVFLFFVHTLLGLPPSVGFIGKYSLLAAALDGQLHWLGLVFMCAMALTGLSFMRIVLVLFDEPLTPSQAHFVSASPHKRLLLIITFLPLFALIFSSDIVLKWSEISLKYILW